LPDRIFVEERVYDDEFDDVKTDAGKREGRVFSRARTLQFDSTPFEFVMPPATPQVQPAPSPLAEICRVKQAVNACGECSDASEICQAKEIPVPGRVWDRDVLEKEVWAETVGQAVRRIRCRHSQTLQEKWASRSLDAITGQRGQPEGTLISFRLLSPVRRRRWRLQSRSEQ